MRRNSSRPPARLARGFTLIEAALTTVIVGVGVLCTMQLFASCSQQNQAASQMSIALMLASNIQEAMGGLSFSDPGTAGTYFGPEPGESLATWDDVDDFDGGRFNPPIDSLRRTIPEMTRYTQVVSVWPVYPSKLSVNSNESSPDIPKSVYTGAVRVKVRILYSPLGGGSPVEIYSASWIRMDN